MALIPSIIRTQAKSNMPSGQPAISQSAHDFRPGGAPAKTSPPAHAPGREIGYREAIPAR